MGPLEVLVILLVPPVAGLPIYIVGRLAQKKGHSVLGYVVFAVIFWPAALIVILLVEDRTRPREVVIANGQAGSDDLARIERLASLRESGAITDQEYEAEKRKALGGS